MRIKRGRARAFDGIRDNFLSVKELKTLAK